MHEEGKRGDDYIEIHINGEPQEIAALVLGIQERQGQDIQIDGHSFLDAIDRAQKRVQILSKTKPNAPMMQCSFSKIGDLLDLVVTPNREIAKRYIEKGYMLLIENMFPACRSCNHYKGTLSVEQFRELVQRIPDTLLRDSVTFKNGSRFGVVQISRKPVVFYFETHKKRKDNMQIQYCKFRITHPLGTKSYEFGWGNIFVYNGTVYAHVPGFTDVELSNSPSNDFARWKIEIVSK